MIIRIPRLCNVPEDVALVDRVDHGPDVRVAGKDHAGRVRVLRLNLREQLHTGHLRHALVRHDDVDVVRLEDVQGLGRAVAAVDVEVHPQQRSQRPQDFGLVIDEQ